MRTWHLKVFGVLSVERSRLEVVLISSQILPFSVKYSSTICILTSLNSRAIHHDRGSCPSSLSGGPGCSSNWPLHHPWGARGCRVSHLLPGVQPVQQMPTDAGVPACLLYRVPPEDPALPLRAPRPSRPSSHPLPPLPPPHPRGSR